MTAVSKNGYFNVSNDIVDNYKNTYHRTIKTKPIIMPNTMFILMRKILNFKFVIM